MCTIQGDECHVEGFGQARIDARDNNDEASTIRLDPQTEGEWICTPVAAHKLAGRLSTPLDEAAKTHKDTADNFLSR
jgi:hypothetical protein